MLENQSLVQGVQGCLIFSWIQEMLRKAALI